MSLGPEQFVPGLLVLPERGALRGDPLEMLFNAVRDQGPGKLLPPAPMLCYRLDVSRHWVRQVRLAMRDEGWLVFREACSAGFAAYFTTRPGAAPAYGSSQDEVFGGVGIYEAYGWRKVSWAPEARVVTHRFYRPSSLFTPAGKRQGAVDEGGVSSASSNGVVEVPRPGPRVVQRRNS